MATKVSSHRSEKHEIIDRANNRIVIAISIAVFVMVFSAFALRALINQSSYHQRVIKEKELALSVLEENKIAAEQLKLSYVSFVTEPINVISGNPTGTGPRDGDNGKIILDSLPSVYDYPALSSSIEKILLDGGYKITAVGGREDASIQQTELGTVTVTSTKSQPVEIPYPFSIAADADSSVRLLQILESSIRPFSIRSLSIKGQDNSLRIDINTVTYYQPANGLQVSSKVVE